MRNQSALKFILIKWFKIIKWFPEPWISLTDQIQPDGSDSTSGQIDMIFARRASPKPIFYDYENQIENPWHI